MKDEIKKKMDYYICDLLSKPRITEDDYRILVEAYEREKFEGSKKSDFSFLLPLMMMSFGIGGRD